MDIRKKQRAVVDALEDIKGRDIVVFNTERLSAYFERVIIATGDSTRQVRALAENVEEELRKLGAKVRGIEGSDNAEWVLVDLGDIVVHVMHPPGKRARRCWSTRLRCSRARCKNQSRPANAHCRRAEPPAR